MGCPVFRVRMSFEFLVVLPFMWSPNADHVCYHRFAPCWRTQGGKDPTATHAGYMTTLRFWACPRSASSRPRQRWFSWNLAFHLTFLIVPRISYPITQPIPAWPNNLRRWSWYLFQLCMCISRCMYLHQKIIWVCGFISEVIRFYLHKGAKYHNDNNDNESRITMKR